MEDALTKVENVVEQYLLRPEHGIGADSSPWFHVGVSSNKVPMPAIDGVAYKVTQLESVTRKCDARIYYLPPEQFGPPKIVDALVKKSLWKPCFVVVDHLSWTIVARFTPSFCVTQSKTKRIFAKIFSLAPSKRTLNNFAQDIDEEFRKAENNLVSILTQMRKRKPMDGWLDAKIEAKRIRQKMQDKQFYLGLVGETSSGKSTLINAMLGFPLLQAKASTQTTSAPTFLTRGESFDIIVEFISGKTIRYSETVGQVSSNLQNAMESARPFLWKYTADERYAADTECVKILLPLDNELFDKGVTIVDTPGLNSQNKRHTGVTQRVLKETCDGVIFVDTAQAAASKSFVSQVSEIIEKITQQNAIYILTHKDTIDEDEEEGDYSKWLVQKWKKLGIEFFDMMILAPYFVVNQKITGAQADNFRREFSVATKKLVQDVRTLRTRAVKNKLVELISSLISDKITPLLEKEHAELTRKQQHLASTALEDFDDWLSRNLEHCMCVFDTDYAKEHLINSIADCTIKFENNLIGILENCENVGQIKEVLKEEYLSTYVKKWNMAIGREVLLPIIQNVSGVAERIAANFHGIFNESFRKLSGYMKEMPELNSFNPDSNSYGEVAGVDLGDVYGIKVAASFTATDALIGTYINPGIGSAIGAGIGFIVGLFASPGYEEVLKNAKGQVANIASKWHESVLQNVVAIFDEEVIRLRNVLKDHCMSYTQYKEEIQAIVAKEHAEMVNIRNSISSLEETQRTLNSEISRITKKKRKATHHGN